MRTVFGTGGRHYHRDFHHDYLVSLRFNCMWVNLSKWIIQWWRFSTLRLRWGYCGKSENLWDWWIRRLLKFLWKNLNCVDKKIRFFMRFFLVEKIRKPLRLMNKTAVEILMSLSTLGFEVSQCFKGRINLLELRFVNISFSIQLSFEIWTVDFFKSIVWYFD